MDCMSLPWLTVSAKLSPTYFNILKMYVTVHLYKSSTDGFQRAETDFFSGEPLRALSTLVYSDNVDLQRSASLTFAEITERGQ
jgi:hypothetical protein